MSEIAPISIPQRPTILAVDDVPQNLSLMSDILEDHYTVKLAPSGARALKIVANNPPDLILLDIMMPDMDGYEVCRILKADPVLKNIPIIFVTAMTEVEDEEKGLEMGAVDYITKPVSPPIVLARVRTHLAVHNQARQLREWNLLLEQRVTDSVAQIERLDRLRRFFSPSVADMLLGSQSEEDILRAMRREIVVVFLDLRGYTAFTEAHEPEEVMRVLGEFHAAMGKLIMAYNGTLERFNGDGMMIFFNAPVEIPDPAAHAARMTLDMQEKMAEIGLNWQSRGYDLKMGVGIAQGLATTGAIGFEGRRDYGAIGRVTNLSSRLCSKADGGQIVCCEVVENNIRGKVMTRQLPSLSLKGFGQEVKAFEVVAA